MQSTTTDQATELLKSRLGEINSERTQIERALTALSPNGSKPARSASKRRGRPKAKRKGSGGTRASEAVGLIAANPGITASEIASKMDIKPNYLYRVLKDLAKTKEIVKKGRKYSVGPKFQPAA